MYARNRYIVVDNGGGVLPSPVQPAKPFSFFVFFGTLLQFVFLKMHVSLSFRCVAVVYDFNHVFSNDCFDCPDT